MQSAWLLEQNPDPTEDEVREGIAGNLCRCTGYVNIVKAVQQAAGELRAAERGRGRHRVRLSREETTMTTEAQAPTTTEEVGGMGHSKKRKEDPRFIRGQGEYIEDVVLPNMVWMDIVRSPYAHAKIKSIDASEALKMPGVLAVITGKDLEKAGLHWMPTLAGDKQMVLPVDEVMYQAQEVAAVIAETRYQAADAITAVYVDYEPLPVVDRPVQGARGRRPGPAARPRPGQAAQPHLALGVRRPGRDRRGARRLGQGRPDRRLHPAHPRRVHRDLRLHRGLRPGARPPGLPRDEPGPARLPHGHQPRVGHPRESSIRVKTHDIGGGFGGKVPVYPGYVISIVASLTLGRPVKWIEDRSENLQADSFARDYHVHAELGLTNDGTITGPAREDARGPRLQRCRRGPVEVPGRPVQRDHRLVRHAGRRSWRWTPPTRTSRPAASPTAARSG